MMQLARKKVTQQMQKATTTEFVVAQASGCPFF
jgi:hypothetical protein